MIEVNVLELKNILISYRDILKRIDSNNEDIIFNFNDLSKKWHDQKSIKLQGSIALEKGRIEKLSENIKNEYSIYYTLYKEYKKLGNKIKYSLDNKDYVKGRINMLDDKIGMVVEKVKINSSKLNSYILEESKIESELKSINDKAIEAYNSTNGRILNTNNKYILEALHTKILNLKSYNSYIDRYIINYKKISGIALDAADNLRRGLNEW